MRGRLPTPRGDARFTQPTGQDPPARPRSAARLHTNSRTTGHATPRTQQTWDGWVGPDRTRSDASLATEDTQWPTPFSHQSSAWLGKFSDSRNRLAPLCLHGGAQRGGAAVRHSASPLRPLSVTLAAAHTKLDSVPRGALLHACSDHGDAKHRRVQSPLQHALSSVHSHTHVEHVEFWPSRPSRIECRDGSQRHAVTRGSPNRLVRIPNALPRSAWRLRRPT